MLTIRKAQTDAMVELRIDEFARGLALELQQELPALCLGVADLTGFVRLGLGRARRHGVDSRGALGRWVRMQLLLGPAFDEDPAHPWAADVLRNPGTSDDVTLMNRLSQAALQALPAEVTAR